MLASLANMPRGVRDLSFARPFFTKNFLCQKLPTTINLLSLTPCSVIQRWRNRFDSDWRHTRYCRHPTTTRHKAMMFSPNQLRPYKRISLCSISSYIHLRKFGVVSAGFKTLVACSSYRNIEGAEILRNMGFEPQRENLSLTFMVEAGKGKNAGHYIMEIRIEEMINIDRNRITGVLHKSTASSLLGMSRW
jgi:hypothetical protein